MRVKKIAKEEILELVWVLEERKKNDVATLLEKSRESNTEKLLDELVRDGYLYIEDNIVNFTPEGYRYAENIIRRCSQQAQG